MFDKDSLPTLRRVGRRLWRVSRRFHKAHTHTPIVEELALESELESADHSSESANSNVYRENICVCVWAFSKGVSVVGSATFLKEPSDRSRPSQNIA